MKNFKYFFILISLFTVIAPNLRAMQETKEVASSVLNFKAIKEQLAAVDFGGCHFSLKKMRTVKIKNDKISKSIELWFSDLLGEKSFIGEIAYEIPIKAKNDAGEYTRMYIDSISVHWDLYQRIGLGTIMTLAALQDALKTNNLCHCAYVHANEKSIGIFKKLDFLKTKKLYSDDEFSTVKLPEIMKKYGPKLLEEAFIKFENAAKAKK